MIARNVITQHTKEQMSRPLRVEFPGAFYHVRARGNRKQIIFEMEADYLYFLNCLRCAHDKFGSIIHAYCLMPNHYHLLVETPGGNLSKIVHLINSMYAGYFNKSKSLCGHPFQGRFNATLVQAEEYARELAAYIHLNPTRAGLVTSPDLYVWSNFGEYAGVGPTRSWSSCHFVLRLFAPDIDRARRRYIEYVQWRQSQNLPNPLGASARTGILGNPDFVRQIKLDVLDQKSLAADRELPQLRALGTKPELSTILSTAATTFGPNNTYAKKAAIFIGHKKTSYALKDISSFFGMSISGISEISRKLQRELANNATLSRAIEEILQSLEKMGPGLLSSNKSGRKQA